MPQDITKRTQIVFSTGLPLGRRGTFTHEGQRWIAVPQTKYQAITTVTDRLTGALAAVQRDITALLAAHPGDTDRINTILGILARADQVRKQALVDKVEAQTA